ncbi:MAG: hypothetical protein ACI9EW_000169 [Cellvibrionaceae bacterium]|jgi:hypothetical protein
MNFSPDSFFIAGYPISWGTTLLELKALLAGEHLIQSNIHHQYPVLHIECKIAYGFGAIEFEADAPEYDLPVQRVRYKLTPPFEHYAQPQPDFWLPKMTGTLGKPAEEYKNPYVNLAMPSSSVVYNYKWNVEDVEIAISIWGGVRQEVTGLSAAGLYINWTNVIKAAEPTIDKNLAMEKKLEQYAADVTALHIFKLNNQQEPYFRKLDTSFKPPADEKVRRAQRTLHRSNLMDTPSKIKEYLADNEIAIWQIEEGARFVVSNMWDSVVIDPHTHQQVSWDNLLPAKGGGYMSFTLSHLTLHDKSSSKKLTAVVEKIQELLLQPIKCHESYDY